MNWRPFLLSVLASTALTFMSGAAEAARLALGFGPMLPPQVLGAPTCPPPENPLERAVWQQTQRQPDLSCGNAFVAYQRTPRTPEAPDAFMQIAAQVREARREVLLTSMEWHSGPDNPGYIFAQGVRDLYAKVAATPQNYPQGMTVRVILGGFPDLKREDGGTYALELVRDLRQLQVPLADARLGWQVTVMNYSVIPHSHVKLHVIDGQDVGVAGFNFTNWHLPGSEPGGRDLHDLGIRIRGPLAQQGVAIFDDLWRFSRQVRCPANVAASEVSRVCFLRPPDPVSHPDAAQQALMAGPVTGSVAGGARAFLLYRRAGGVDEADRAQLALIDAARQEIDLMQADFSPALNCWAAYLGPDNCGSETFPPYLAALLRAMERGVRVRVLTVNYGFGAGANRSGIALMRYEARRRGLDQLFEARYVNFNMHTKALSVDHGMVAVGSMNFHFSSWGPAGLNEAFVATSDAQAVREQEESFNAVWARQSQAVAPPGWLRFVRPLEHNPPALPKQEQERGPRRSNGQPGL
ncbi:phospholipase D-like domain-containing protein [Deinococcus cavernae]|nr:phospholipase D-like domain-containing protein [Deinococcus cavernae]